MHAGFSVQHSDAIECPTSVIALVRGTSLGQFRHLEVNVHKNCRPLSPSPFVFQESFPLILYRERGIGIAL